MKFEGQLIGIIGAGQMGLGIAQVLATSELDVIVHDNDNKMLSRAPKMLEKSIMRAVDKGKLTEANSSGVLDRIVLKSQISDLANCDLIIEAATEDELIKHKIFQSLIPNLRPDTILTSNTSSISITRLAARTDRPDKFMGCHFMKPAPIMQLVELVRGIATSNETTVVLKSLVEKIGKTATYSEDFPAFIVNRILMPMINEGIYALYEGVGTVHSIDTSMKLGANHPMGPLELADFIGLDTCLAIMNSLHDGLADTKYRPCPLLVKYVEANWLGKKNGMGFYNYSSNPAKPTR
ncbi:MAG: 3-hydroxybutyryl-CoA dehydrogenase [Rhodobacteraceae bacterium]|nr:3-hydroxybutyryl-CoA dehydrogenase [Paracoccaceae bacterium]